ncbi:MAG: murein hydrolase activator EnvC family protein [Christensenellales bacterium]|jgi:murein DD-endopeptidase MepM/ murein hydrolase activator NlpD
MSGFQHLPKVELDRFSPTHNSKTPFRYQRPTQRKSVQSTPAANAETSRSMAAHTGGDASRSRAFSDSAKSERRSVSDEDRKMSVLLIKMGVCAALALGIFAISLADTPAADQITDNVKSVMNYSIDIDEMFGKLKYVDNASPGSNTASSRFTEPVAAKISLAFGLAGYGITYGETTGRHIVASADGRVSSSGYREEAGYYVFIDHGAGIETRYYGLQESFAILDEEVEKGQRIGTGGEALMFEVWQNGKAVNPATYFSTAL